MSLVHIPFDGGMNEGIEQALLPQGVFREVRNMRLSRDGKLVPRPQLTALGVDLPGAGDAVAFDLWRYRDQLIAVGRRSTTGTPDALDNAWVYVDAGSDWSPVDTVQGATANVTRLPQITNVRDLPRAAPSSGGVAGAHVAAGGGFVCSVWGDSTGGGFVLVQRASDGAQVLYQRLDSIAASAAYIMPQVLYINTSFVIVAHDTDDDLRVMTFRPDTDTALSAAGNLFAAAASTDFQIAPVRGDTTAFVTIISNATPQLRILGSTVGSNGVVSASGLFAAVDVDLVTTYDDVTICADSTAGVFVAARIAATGLVTAWTYTIGGVLSVGPTADVFNATADAWTGTGDRLVSCVVDEDSAAYAVLLTTDAAVATLGLFTAIEPRTFAAHAAAGRERWYGSYATSGILGKTTGSGANGALLVFGGVLEGFRSKGTSATDLRVFQGTSNMLAQVRHEDTTSDKQLAATFDRGIGGIQPLTVTTDAGAMQGRIANMAQDASTGKCYCVRLVTEPFAMVTNGHNRECQFVVCEFDFGGTSRRQTAELDSQLFVAGGQPLLFAGAGPLIEPSFDTPQITSVTPSNGAGTLTNLGVYNWRVVFRHIDAQGRVHLSPPSVPVQSTFGAADDTATIGVKTPHSRRQIDGSTSLGGRVQIELYRTQNGGATFRLVSRTDVSTFGAGQSITDTTPDTDIADRPILYTQSQTPVAHDMAPPCKYAVAARSRVVLGGTNDETEVVFSKLVFPGEPIEFAPPGLLGYRKSIGEPVTALMGLDEQVLVASGRSIYRIAGAGPDHSGLGEFLDPERIPGLGGVSDWRSVVEVPTGYFFQSSDTKLYFVDRSGAVSWVQGQAVRDTLATFPTITAATYAREQNCVFFACRNSQGSDGVLLVFDLRRECWYIDSDNTVLAGTVTAAVDYNKRLTVASAGVVYQESAGTYNTDTNRVVTGNIRNGSLCSWNHLRRIGIRGSGLGVGSPTPRVDMYIDVENGSGFTLIDQHTVSSSGNFIKFWRVPNQKVDSFKLQIDSIGVALNELVLDIEPRRGVSRRNPSDLK